MGNVGLRGLQIGRGTAAQAMISRSSLLLSHIYRDLDKKHEIEEYQCRRRYQLDDSGGYCCLLILENVGRAATMFVTTPIIIIPYHRRH